MAWNRNKGEKQEEQPVRRRISIAQAAAWTNPVSGTEEEEVTIRRAEAGDAEIIYGYLKKMRDVESVRRPDIVDADQEILSLDEVKEAIADGAKDIFVAINKNDKLVGQILCEYEMTEAAVPADPEGEEDADAPAAENKVSVPGKLVIANIFVTQDERRSGIGSQLYRKACDEAGQKGARTVELSCWSFDREGIAFFESQGYTPLLVTMEKKLGN